MDKHTVINGKLYRRECDNEDEKGLNAVFFEEKVNHPSHYNQYDIETIDMMVSVFGKKSVAEWCKLTAFKYRMRLGLKEGNPLEQDLAKEKWYLNKAKELLKDGTAD